MSRRTQRFAALGLACLLACAGLAPAQAKKAKKTDPIQTQRVVVRWKGDQRKKPVYQRRASVPGIGNLAVVCRPKSTMIRLVPYNTAAETQMWLAKYQDTDGDERADSVAVKTVRVYRYSTADDDGRGGTGRSAHEGLNRKPSIENRSEGGYAYGIISQRPGRNRPAGGAGTPPITTFRLSWNWNGFDHPRPWRSCKIALRTKTFRTSALALNWHGDPDAAGHTVASAPMGAVTFTASCETGQGGDRSLSIGPSRTSVYLEEISGEGDIDDHVDSYTQPADSFAGRIEGIELPRNGMIRLKYGARWYLLSSYAVVNNAAKPWLNVCEVAAAPPALSASRTRSSTGSAPDSMSATGTQATASVVPSTSASTGSASSATVTSKTSATEWKSS